MTVKPHYLRSTTFLFFVPNFHPYKLMVMTLNNLYALKKVALTIVTIIT